MSVPVGVLGIGLALVDEAHLEVRRRLREVGEVLLAPFDGLLEPAVAGQVDDRARGERVARLLLGLQLGVGVLQRQVELVAGVVEPAVGARDRDPDRLDGARADRHAVAQLAADALAVRAVVAGAGRRGRVAAGAHGAGLRTAEARAGLARPPAARVEPTSAA